MKNTMLSIEGFPIEVEIADTEDSRALGLMGRQSLSHDSGMLFVFDQPDNLSFWMKNTHIPLSIAFISETGEIINIENMYPHDHGNTRSSKPATCALEVNQGWFKQKGIHPGCIVKGIPARKTFITEERIRTIVRKIILE